MLTYSPFRSSLTFGVCTIESPRISEFEEWRVQYNRTKQTLVMLGVLIHSKSPRRENLAFSTVYTPQTNCQNREVKKDLPGSECSWSLSWKNVACFPELLLCELVSNKLKSARPYTHQNAEMEAHTSTKVVSFSQVCTNNILQTKLFLFYKNKIYP